MRSSGGSRSWRGLTLLAALFVSTARSPRAMDARTLGPLDEPAAVAVGPDGSIYVCESRGHRVSVFDPQGVLRTRWGRFGRAEGEFDGPRGIAVGGDGRIYVSDTGNHRVQVFSGEGRFERQWGRFGSDAGEFNAPAGLTVTPDRVLVADSRNDRVEVFDHDARLLFYIWSYGFSEGKFDGPVDVAAGRDGDLYVSDQGNSRVQRFDRDGRSLSSWGGWGFAGPLLAEPGGIESRDGRLFVADTHNHRVASFDAAGGFLRDWKVPGGLRYPTDVAALPSGEGMVVCGAAEDRCVVLLHPDELPLAGESAPVATRYTYAVGGTADWLVVAERETGSIVVLDLGSRAPVLLAAFGARGREPLEFVRPAGVAVDPRNAALFVSDAGNRRLQLLRLGRRPEEPRRFDSARTRFVKSIFLFDQEELERFPGSWKLSPASVAPGPLQRDGRGRLWLVDTVFARIVVLDEQLRLVASWGGFGDGDGRFRAPTGLALDEPGATVYVVDAGSRRVQAFDEGGRFRFAWGSFGRGPGEFVDPRGVATGRDGSVYVVDRGARRVQRFDGRGKLLGAWTGAGPGRGEFVDPEGVFVDRTDRVIVIDSGRRRAEAFTRDGRFLWERSLDPAAIAAGSAFRP